MNAVEIVQDKGPCGPQANACFKTAGSAKMMDSRFEAVMSRTEYAELFADINRRIEREVISSFACYNNRSRTNQNGVRDLYFLSEFQSFLKV